MRSAAFCPAHITGFFKACMDVDTEYAGSMGAGFSIKTGVTTHVDVLPRHDKNDNFNITTHGYTTDKTDVSKYVLDDFMQRGAFEKLYLEIKHEISVPVGYGLGSSGAVALSLSYALNRALRTDLDQHTIGKIAHNAEVKCKTGLGDVLASYHGGFEVRVKPGAPGIGVVEKLSAEPVSIVVICFSPISTNAFIREHLAKINGLGGKMVSDLLRTRNCGHFQDMSLEFAKYVNVVTPRMRDVIEELSQNGIKCGVALFGETVFSMIPPDMEGMVLKILEKYEGVIIRSELDRLGARMLYN